MSELISSVEFKKIDGAPINFNFQFENGLPIKPLLNANGSIWYSKKDDCYGISIILTKDDLKKVTNYTINNVSYHETDNLLKENIWVHLENIYLVMQNLDKENITKLKNNGVAVLFFSEENIILN